MNKVLRRAVLVIGAGLLVTLSGCHYHSGYYAGYTYYGYPYLDISVSHLSHKGHHRHGYSHKPHRFRHGHRGFRHGGHRGFRHGGHRGHRSWRH